MWSETTVINPAAWSPRVEQDLLEQIEKAHGAPELDLFDAACAQARDLLAGAAGPQTVTLSAQGATVVPFVLPDETAHQAELEARRAFFADVAAGDDARFAADLRKLASAESARQALADAMNERAGGDH